MTHLNFHQNQNLILKMLHTLYPVVPSKITGFPCLSDEILSHDPSSEACIGVLGIQDICHFTSRDIGYFPFYFQGYRILCSISGILLIFLLIYKYRVEIPIILIKNHFKISTKEEQLYVLDMARLSRHSITCSANALIYPR